MTDSTRNAGALKTASSTPGRFPGSTQGAIAHRLLAIDLGKFKSVACDYDTTNGTHTFTTLPTRPQDFHDLLAEEEKRRKGV